MAAERARHGIASLTESLLSESTDFGYADDSIITNQSLNFDDSVFDTERAFDSIGNALNGTTSVTDLEPIQTVMRSDTPLTKAYNEGVRRFEHAMGTSSISNDVIKLSPVSHKSLTELFI